MTGGLARAIYYPCYRVLVRARCAAESIADSVRRAPEGMPLPPPSLRFRVSGTPSRSVFLETGQRTAGRIVDCLAAVARNVGDFHSILDFGCGCGRTLAWFDAPAARIHGCDTDADAIAWCRAHMTWASFSVNQPEPPLPYEDGAFDLVYAISVFTHLDEAAQDAWLSELRRVVTPGGLALVSLHGERAWRDLPYRDEIERQGFLFKRSAKLRGICPDWYQTAFHTEAYVRERFARNFAVRAYLPEGMGFHDAVLLERA